MPKLQLGNYFRVVVTGDRDWPNEGYYVVKKILERLPKNALVVTGGARGADTQADLIAFLLGYKTRVVKAEWSKYGPHAGPRRNQQMLVEFKPHVVIGFHNDLAHSKGTKDCVEQARGLKIPCRIYNLDGKVIKLGERASKIIP